MAQSLHVILVLYRKIIKYKFYIILFFKGYLIIMKKYFTIILATVMTSLSVMSTAQSKQNIPNAPCGDNDDVCWDNFYKGGGTVPGKTFGGTGVSEPAAVLVAVTALGLFVAARRRKVA